MTSSSSLMQMRGNHDIKFLLLTQHKYLHTMLKDLGDVLKNDPHVTRMWPERGKNSSKIPRVVLPKCSGYGFQTLTGKQVRQPGNCLLFHVFSRSSTFQVFFLRRVRQELKMMENSGITISGGDQFFAASFSEQVETTENWKPFFSHHEICCLIHVFNLHVHFLH